MGYGIRIWDIGYGYVIWDTAYGNGMRDAETDRGYGYGIRDTDTATDPTEYGIRDTDTDMGKRIWDTDADMLCSISIEIWDLGYGIWLYNTAYGYGY